MAVSPRIFALDFDRGLISGNPTVETGYTFRHFKSGDTERLRIYLVKANTGAGTGALTIINNDGLTLKVALGNLVTGATPASPYTSVTLTASADGNYFEGDLPLNVSGITSLFSASVADVQALIEFELDDGGYKQSFDRGITIRQQLIPSTLIDTPAPDTAIGNQEATARFVPKTGATQIAYVDQDGSGREYLFDIYNGAIRLTQIA